MAKKKIIEPVPAATDLGQENPATDPAVVPAGTETKAEDHQRGEAGDQPVPPQPVDTAEVDPPNEGTGDAKEGDNVTDPGQENPATDPAGTETKAEDHQRGEAGDQPVPSQPVDTAEVDPPNEGTADAKEGDTVADDGVPEFIRQAAKEAFRKLAVRRLWFTGDGLGFDDERNARQHAATFRDMKVYVFNN
jgi:hypothetical protein